MNTFLAYWVQLTEEFGTAGAAMILIYGGLVALLLVSMLLATMKPVRRAIRKRRLSRELRLVHRDAYRERPQGRGRDVA